MPEEESGQAPATEDPPAPQTDEKKPPKPEEFDPDRAMHTIRTQREEIKALKQTAKGSAELAAKLKEFEDRDKSDGEKTAERLAELERTISSKDERIQQLTLQGAFSKVGREAGALYPEDLLKLVDLSKVEFDEAGNPKNLTELVEALKVDRPVLFGQSKPGSADLGARSPTSGSGPSMDDRLRQAARGR